MPDTSASRIADGAVAAILRSDGPAFDVLVREVTDPDQLHDVIACLAGTVADSLVYWSELLGQGRAEALASWQQLIVRSQLPD